MLILILLPAICWQKSLEPCSVKQESTKSLFSTQETFEWNLKDIFSGSYLNYSLSAKQSFFTIKKPLHQEYAPVYLMEGISKIVAIQAMTEKSQKVWLHQFAFVEKYLNVLSLFYSEGTQGDFRPPYFNKKITFSYNQDLQCLSLEYLNETTFLVDCYNYFEQKIENQFFIINKSGTIKNISNSNYDVLNFITKRITRIINFVDTKKNQVKLLVRATPAYAQGGELSKQSIIEFFDAVTVKFMGQISNITIGKLLGYEEYDFTLIDFEIFADGKLYILTENDGILILAMNQEYGFSLLDRIELSDKVKEFDVGRFMAEDGSLKEVIGVLFENKAEIYEDRMFKDNYNLDFIPTYTSLLKISQELLIIQNKGKTYLINIQTGDLIHKEVLEGIQGLLINQYLQELIYVTQVDARRLILSSGKLRFKSGDLNASRAILTITAKDQFDNSCYATVVYGIYNSQDSKIYPLSDLELPDVYLDYPRIAPFQVPVSGPNIQYVYPLTIYSDNADESKVSINIKRGGSINVESLYSKIPSAKQSQFIKLISLDDEDSVIAVVIQVAQNKTILTYLCSTDQYDDGQVNLQCINYKDFQVNFDLNNLNFQCFFRDGALYVMLMEDAFRIKMYSISSQDIQFQFEINYEEHSILKAQSIKIIANRLYVVLNNIYIDIWDIETKQNFLITEEIVRSLGFKGNWNVSKTVGNSRYHPSILFIINNDNIIIADYHKELTIIKVLNFTEAKINVAIGIDTFFVVVHTTTKTQILEYDFSNYCKIFQMKELPTYKYKFQQQLAMTSSVDSGLLYIGAIDTENEDQSVILAYKPRSPLRDSLIKVTFPKRQPYSIYDVEVAAAGLKHFIFYWNDGVNHNMEWIDQVYQYQIIPTYKTTKWINKFRINLTMSNLKSNPNLTLSQAILLQQTRTSIYFINNNLEIPIQKWKQSQITLNMTGTIVDYDIQCQQCGFGKTVDLVQPVRLRNQESGQDFNVVDQYVSQNKTNADFRLVLISKKNQQLIQVYNNQNEYIKDIIITTNPQMSCEKLTMTWTQILVTCVADQQYQIATIWCSSVYTCGDQIKFSTLPKSVIHIPAIHAYDQYLVFVNAFSTNLKSNDTYLNLYQIAINNSTYTATYTLIKQISSVQLFYQHFIKCMIHYQNGYSAYLIIAALTTEGKLAIFDINLKLTQSYQLDDIIAQNDGEIINKEFTDFNIITNPTYSSYVVTINLLFSSQSLNYKFQLVYDTYSQKAQKFTLDYTLSRYLDAQSLPGLQIDRQLLQAAIPYRYQNKIVISVYQLPNIAINDKRMVYAYGGVSENHDFNNPSNVACSIYKNVLKLGFSENYKENQFILNSYDVNFGYIIEVNDLNGKLYEQEVVLSLSNDAGVEEFYFNIKISSNDREDLQEEPEKNDHELQEIKEYQQ